LRMATAPLGGQAPIPATRQVATALGKLLI
jgi:hypothetical protein